MKVFVAKTQKKKNTNAFSYLNLNAVNKVWKAIIGKNLTENLKHIKVNKNLNIKDFPLKRKFF